MTTTLSLCRRRAIAAAAVLLLPAAVSASTILPTYTNVDAPARAVVDAAIGAWENLLTDAFTFSVSIERAYLSGTPAFSSNFTEVSGRPSSGRILFDDGSGAVPWFVDDSPDDDVEFHSGHDAFHAVANQNGPAAGAVDLLTVIFHELGHVLGFSVFYSNFAAHVVDRPDGNREYVGATVTAPLTGAGGGTHILPEEQPFDLMNPALQLGHRLSPSPLDLAVLHDAFDYTVSPAQPLQPVPEPAVSLLVALSMLATLARRSIR